MKELLLEILKICVYHYIFYGYIYFFKVNFKFQKLKMYCLIEIAILNSISKASCNLSKIWFEIEMVTQEL